MDVPPVDKLPELDKIRHDADRISGPSPTPSTAMWPASPPNRSPQTGTPSTTRLSVPFIPARQQANCSASCATCLSSSKRTGSNRTARRSPRRGYARSLRAPGRLALALSAGPRRTARGLLRRVWTRPRCETAGDQIGERLPPWRRMPGVRVIVPPAPRRCARNRGPGRGREAAPPGRPGRAAPEPGPRRRSSAAAAALVPPLASGSDSRGWANVGSTSADHGR